TKAATSCCAACRRSYGVVLTRPNKKQQRMPSARRCSVQPSTTHYRWARMVDARQTEQTLRRQLVAFAQFTTRSLTEPDIPSLMLDACLRARAGMDMTHAKIMEYLPNRDRLLLRAGVGWKEGYVGQYQVPPDIDTPIGNAFALSQSVAIPDYPAGTAFR